MLEIERKFLVDVKKWSPKDKGVSIVQGYLSTDKERVVRVRIKGKQAFLTIKGKQKGISRMEMEYEIPENEAQELLKLCVGFTIKKTRYTEEIAGMTWEIDVFDDFNQGLVLAEVELADENQEVLLPDWLLNEVSTDHRYFNSWLTLNPYKNWVSE